MANFFEKQRDALGLNRTEMGARLGTTAETVRCWEQELQYPLRVPIKRLAVAYGVAESKVADEVMSLRRRIEAREEKAVTSK